MSHPIHGPSIGIGHIIAVCVGLGLIFSFALVGVVDIAKISEDGGDCQASSFMVDMKVEESYNALANTGGNQSVYFIMNRAGVGAACTDQVVGNLTTQKPVVEQEGWLILEKYAH